MVAVRLSVMNVVLPHCIVGYFRRPSVQCLHTVIHLYFTGNSMQFTYYWFHTKISDIGVDFRGDAGDMSPHQDLEKVDGPSVGKVHFFT